MVSVGVGRCLVVCTNSYEQVQGASVGFDSSVYPDYSLVTLAANPVPEPGTFAPGLIGLLLLALRRQSSFPYL